MADCSPCGNGSSTAAEGRPPRPQALPVLTDAIPAELQALPQWVVWRHTWSKAKQKWDKPPVNAKTNKLASSTDPATWSDYPSALQIFRQCGRVRGLDGLGLVLADNGGIVGIDLDHCRDPATGELATWAAAIVADLATYSEASPSGEGVRLFLCGELGGTGRKRAAADVLPSVQQLPGLGLPEVEVYDRGRYLTVTGHRLDGAPATVEERPEQLARLYELLGRRRTTSDKSGGFPGRASDAASHPDDEAILRLLRRERGGKAARLLDGDTTGYASKSEADAALAAKIVYYTRDRDQVRRLLCSSGINPDKYRREDYLERTIDAALELVTAQYEPRRRAGRNGTHRRSENGAPPAEGQADEGPGLLPEWPPPAVTVLRQWLQDRYAPTFRRGRLLYSALLARDVSVSEIAGTPTSEVLGLLAEQLDAPRLRGSAQVDAQQLPYHYRTWLPVAWGDLAASLPEEADAAEVVEPAADEFRRRLAAALLTLVPLSYGYAGPEGDRVEVQRRPLVEWARLFAKVARWESVRGYRLWSRRDGDTLRVALRAELLGQLHCSDLRGLSQRRLNGLCTLYGLGSACHVAGGGRRATELTADFLADLLAGPAEETMTQDDQTHAPACEGAS